jgi:rubrerythrin
MFRRRAVDKRADQRDQRADQRDQRADERDQRADERDQRADQREREADERDQRANQREHQADRRDDGAELRAVGADVRDQEADQREERADRRDVAMGLRERALASKMGGRIRHPLQCPGCGAEGSEIVDAVAAGQDCPVCGVPAETLASFQGFPTGMPPSRDRRPKDAPQRDETGDP